MLSHSSMMEYPNYIRVCNMCTRIGFSSNPVFVLILHVIAPKEQESLHISTRKSNAPCKANYKGEIPKIATVHQKW